MELEAAVARGKSKYGDVTVTGQGVRTRKTNFRCPQVEQQSPIATPPSSAVRLRKVVRPQPGPPLPARTPKVSSYISNGRDRENNDRDRS